MEVDTGSAVSIDLKRLKERKLASAIEANTILFVYSDEQLALMGEIQVRVKYQTQEVLLLSVVAEGDKPVLLKRNWLEKLNVFQVNALDGLISKYRVLFEKGYGHLK